MPIYEFYCSKCNTIYNFFSRSINTGKTPKCPKCKEASLTRQMSMFAAITGGGKSEESAELFTGIDERIMEKELARFAGAAEAIKDDDPRTAAQMIRKLSEATGLKLGDGLQDVFERLAKGKDPDKMDEEIGNMVSAEDPFGEKQSKKTAVKRKPQVDDTLYEL
jgi:putative FmdB family regulatory protein